MESSALQSNGYQIRVTDHRDSQVIILGAPSRGTMSSDDQGEALFWEARHGRTEGVHELLAQGAPVNWVHPLDGRSALGAAACFDHASALAALLAAGADVHLRDTLSGHTALAIAAIEGSVRCLC